MLRYIGPGYLLGVPARDLTDEETARFGAERLVATGLYVAVEDKVERPKRETKQDVHVKPAALTLRGDAPDDPADEEG